MPKRRTNMFTGGISVDHSITDHQAYGQIIQRSYNLPETEEIITRRKLEKMYDILRDYAFMSFRIQLRSLWMSVTMAPGEDIVLNVAQIDSFIAQIQGIHVPWSLPSFQINFNCQNQVQLYGPMVNFVLSTEPDVHALLFDATNLQTQLFPKTMDTALLFIAPYKSGNNLVYIQQKGYTAEYKHKLHAFVLSTPLQDVPYHDSFFNSEFASDKKFKIEFGNRDSITYTISLNIIYAQL